jgi:hypothetical protein
MANRTLFEALTGYESAAPETPGLLMAGAPGGGEEGEGEPSEEQFLEIIQRLQVQAETDPELAKKFQDAFGFPPSPELLKEKLAEARQVVEEAQQPAILGGGMSSDFAAQQEALEGPALLGVPSDFGDRYIEEHVVERYRAGFSRIDLEPKLRRFEDDNVLGIVGWFLFNGPNAVTVPRRLSAPFSEQFGRILGAEKFRRHGADQFVYKLNEPAGGRTRVALFADFGTGLSHARFIARQLEVDRFDAAVHLGDVYYTGTPKQYRTYFEEPLEPALQNGTKLFVIPDNHDGYSGFHAYVDFLDRRLQQGGSYFALETQHVQFIGVDTIWHSDRGRIEDAGVREWLKARFAAGRASGRANVFMTGHHPYEYTSQKLTELNRDVLELTDGGIDFWFWGNTHYCALFDRTVATPYYGSCIGHAGYPYKKQVPKDVAPPSAAPVLFVESGSRYEGSDVRTDRGMNGFCSFEIQPGGSVELHYRDWRGHERCIARFAKQANGSLLLTGAIDDRT